MEIRFQLLHFDLEYPDLSDSEDKILVKGSRDFQLLKERVAHFYNQNFRPHNRHKINISQPSQQHSSHSYRMGIVIWIMAQIYVQLVPGIVTTIKIGF